MQTSREASRARHWMCMVHVDIFAMWQVLHLELAQLRRWWDARQSCS